MQIEHYCYEEHEEIRQAAVECLCNMVVNEEVCTECTRYIHTMYRVIQKKTSEMRECFARSKGYSFA